MTPEELLDLANTSEATLVERRAEAISLLLDPNVPPNTLLFLANTLGSVSPSARGVISSSRMRPETTEILVGTPWADLYDQNDFETLADIHPHPLYLTSIMVANPAFPAEFICYLSANPDMRPLYSAVLLAYFYLNPAMVVSYNHIDEWFVSGCLNQFFFDLYGRWCSDISIVGKERLLAPVVATLRFVAEERKGERGAGALLKLADMLAEKIEKPNKKTKAGVKDKDVPESIRFSYDQLEAQAAALFNEKRSMEMLYHVMQKLFGYTDLLSRANSAWGMNKEQVRLEIIRTMKFLHAQVSPGASYKYLLWKVYEVD